jgi:hypothetical protein
MQNQQVTELFKTNDPLDLRDSELAMVGAIIGDHLGNQIYEAQKEGYISMVYTIANISRTFVDLYLDYDWETLLDNDIPSSFPTSVDCWDDAVIWFAIQELKKMQINVKSINF